MSHGRDETDAGEKKFPRERENKHFLGPNFEMSRPFHVSRRDQRIGEPIISLLKLFYDEMKMTFLIYSKQLLIYYCNIIPN